MSIVTALYGLLFGDFHSVGSIEATTFHIVVDAEVGEDARRILAKDLRSVW